jgi:DNA-binding NarL/FixJ family response regulator
MNTTDFYFRKSNRQKKMDRKRYHQPIARKERFDEHKDSHKSKFAPLTERQREALHSLSYGKVAKQIGDDLGIAPNTARKHIQNALGSLELNKETAGVRWYVETENNIPTTVGKRA